MQCNSVRNTVFQIRILPLFCIQPLLGILLRSVARSWFASSEKLNPPFRAKWVSGMKIVWLLMLPYYSLMGGAQLSLSVLLLCNNNCRFCTFTVHIHFEVSSLQASPLSALLTCFDMACTFPAITINNTHTETIATVTTLTVSKHSPTCKT